MQTDTCRVEELDGGGERYGKSEAEKGIRRVKRGLVHTHTTVMLLFKSFA